MILSYCSNRAILAKLQFLSKYINIILFDKYKYHQTFDSEDLRNTSELATYGIDLETLQYAEDKNERPHTEFIPDSQDFVLIFNSLDLYKYNII